MKQKSILKIISGLIVVFLILSEFQFFVPQKAQALGLEALQSALGLGDAVATAAGVTVNVVGNPHDTVKTIMESVARGVASGIIDAVINKFVSKLVEKYKIRSYLYYDQVLTNYYLNRYLADKITDPDLKQIYTLLYSAKVTGEPTGTTGGPDPRKALIPRIKQAMADYYLKQGGIDSSKVYNPAPGTSDIEYFQTAQAYFSNPPSFTEQNLQGQFGAFQSMATTAAQFEISVGNGLKAGRVVGGSCRITNNTQSATPAGGTLSSTLIGSGMATAPGTAGNITTAQACTAAGGTWQVSALDQARSFIDNPTIFTEKYLQSGLNSIFTTKYDPNNFWYVIGKATGNFIFNQLSLNKSGGTLPEDPTNPYVPSDGSDTPTPSMDGIDLDGDGLPDGYDVNGDGIIDTCVYGGTAPDCKGSIEVTTPPTPPAPDCTTSPESLACNSSDHSDVVTRVKAYLISRGQQFNTFCDAFEIVKRVAWALRGEGIGLMTTGHTTQCNGFSADVIAYTDNSGVDILTSAGPPDNTNGPTWQPMPPSTEPGSVHYAPPSDPGDPAGSY